MFEALSTVEPPITWDDVASRIETDVAIVDLTDLPRSRSPRGRIAVAVAAAAIVAVVVVVATRDSDAPRTPRISSSGSTGPVPTQPVPTTLPETRSNRHLAVTAWTGSQYLVWSGEAAQFDAESGRADGWMYDPQTDRSTEIPVAPIAPRSAAAGVWTGEELIVCCGLRVADGTEYDTGTAAAYRPETRTWRRLADPPAVGARGFGAAVWTGTEMIVVFAGRDDQGPRATIAYDPATDRWRRLADPPELAISPQAAWTGQEMIVWSPEYGFRSNLDRGYRYDPATDSWSTLPDVPAANAPSLGSMAWTGDEIIVYGQSAVDETRAAGARLRLGDDAWTPLPDPGLLPIDWGEGTPGSQSLAWNARGHELVVWPVHGSEYGTAGPPLLTFDPDLGTWTQIVLAASLGYEPDLKVGLGALFRPDRERPVVAHVKM
jgi:hypothetical protein